MNRTDKEPGASVPHSPRFFRRKIISQVSNESTNTSQGKVVLGEVEQKLKSMRQKRLDRLSTFVVEQSKLSEERENKNKEGNEIEEAIMSMKQANDEKKTSFTSIVEEHVTEIKGKVNEEIESRNNSSAPRTPKLSRKSSNESVDKSKQSSTKKFINKLNCTTTQSVGSSLEDLNGDYEEGLAPNTVTVRHNSKPEVMKRTSFEEDKSKKVENITNISNPLLSPIGKQRKGIYLYERECKFLDNEKSQAMFTFTKRENTSQQEVAKKLEPGITTIREALVQRSAEFGKTLDINPEQTPKTTILEVKTRNSYENRSTVASADKPPLLLKTFKRNSLGDSLDGKFVNKADYNPVSVPESPGIDKKNYHFIKKTEATNQQGYAKISKYSNLTNYKNLELQFQQNEKETGSTRNNVPPKSPMPLPRRTSHEERILKKFQRNWDSLNEITENDSDVDSDEIEDLKKTFEEVNTLLVEYCSKLNRLERKTSDDDYCKKLIVMKEELQKIEEEIPKFKGLKRDSSYLQLNNKLSNFLSEIHKIKSSKADVHSEKQLVLKQAESLLKILENRVERNENILFEVLDAQVSSISTNIFNITRV